MRKIRRNTFETNSSSTHAICIPRKGKLKYNPVIFSIGEFGWEYDVYHDSNSKASYLYTAIYSCDADSTKRDFILTIKNWLDEEEIKYTFNEVKYSKYHHLIDGYIDHDENCVEFLKTIFSDKNIFLTYLFDERAYVSTGNDNDSGYYIPEIGYKYETDDWDDEIEKLQENNYTILKGN